MILYKRATITGNFTVILLCILCFNLIKSTLKYILSKQGNI